MSSRNSAFIVCVVRALSHGQFDCHDQGNDYSCHRQVGAVLVCSDLSQLRDLQLALALRRVSSAKCCSHLSLHSPHFQTYRNFLHMLHVAMAQSCFYYSTVCYVGLPFVITSCFHINRAQHCPDVGCGLAKHVCEYIHQRAASFSYSHHKELAITYWV